MIIVNGSNVDRNQRLDRLQPHLAEAYVPPCEIWSLYFDIVILSACYIGSTLNINVSVLILAYCTNSNASNII